MSDFEAPRYGQRAFRQEAPECPRHPGRASIDYCKRCNRPMCLECAIPTEVRSICVDCAGQLRQHFTRPSVTRGLIIACLAMFAVGWLLPKVQLAFLFMPAAGVYEPWRFLTAAFLHSGFMHLAFNMLALYWVGQSIEPILGHAKFLALYLLSALGGSVAVLAWTFVNHTAWITATVGASGAVFGLFAAIFVLQKLSGSNTTAILVLLGINLLYGFISPGISWQAHVGGLLTGAAVTWVFMKLSRPKAGVTARKQHAVTALATAAMAAVLIALAVVCYLALLTH